MAAKPMDDKELERIMQELLGDTGTSDKAKPVEPSKPMATKIPPSSYGTGMDLSTPSSSSSSGVSSQGLGVSTPPDTSKRSIEPNGNVPLIGMRDYKTEALGFFMIDGKIYESIDDQLHGV